MPIGLINSFIDLQPSLAAGQSAPLKHAYAPEKQRYQRMGRPLHVIKAKIQKNWLHIPPDKR
jgi:hypothetical protein